MNQMTIASVIVAIGLIGAAVIASGGVLGGSNGTKTFNIVMENNRYNPAEVVVSVGDQVIINFENRDAVAHGIALAEFNASVPGGHIQPGSTAQMKFFADRAINTDAAVCGGPSPSDKTDNHGEELVVRVLET